jgi:alpha-glucosidase
VAGVCIDSAALLVKDPDSRRRPAAPASILTDREPLLRSTGLARDRRQLSRAQNLVGEVWLPDAARFARYLPGRVAHRLHFDPLACPFDADIMRTSIIAALDAHAPVDAPTTQVLSTTT